MNKSRERWWLAVLDSVISGRNLLFCRYTLTIYFFCYFSINKAVTVVNFLRNIKKLKR